MAEITNIAKILKYTFDSGNGVGPEKTASVSNPLYVDPILPFSKVCSPVDSSQTNAYLNEPILLTYTVANLKPIGFTIAEINDSIFTNSAYGEIIAGSETGGTYDETTNTITFDPDNDFLNPGETATFTIQVRVTDATAPLSILNTTATLLLHNEDSTSTLIENFCDIQFVHADVSVTKANNPDSSTVVTSGDVITYTINLINEGNSEAQIAIDDFVDDIPAGTTFSQITSGAPTIEYDATNNLLRNASVITLGTTSSGTNEFEIVYEVTVD